MLGGPAMLAGGLRSPPAPAVRATVPDS